MNRGISVIFQKLLVASEVISVVKHFCGKPARSRARMAVRVFTLDFIAKRARADYPAAIAVRIFGVGFRNPRLCVFLRFGKICLKKVRVSLERLGNVCRKGVPIVHLNIDIMPESASPRRFIMNRPHALKRSGRRSFSRRRYEQISAVLIVYFFQIRFGISLPVRL